MTNQFNDDENSRLNDYDLMYMLENYDHPDFLISDIKEVVACVPGEADGASWYYILELHDGSYVFGTGWCDYTGWGCQDGGKWSKKCTREDIFNHAIDEALDPEFENAQFIKEQLERQIDGTQPYGLFVHPRE